MELSRQDREDILNHRGIYGDIFSAAEVLYSGKSVVLEVPDYEFGRMLVAGDDSALKEVVEAMLHSWGSKYLHAETIKFLVVDFADADPESIREVLETTKAEIPDIRKAQPWGDERFSNFYPGLVVAVIGGETIPQEIDRDIDLNFLGTMAKYCPLVFIQKEGTNKRLDETNRWYFRAVGEYTSMSFQAIKRQG